MNQITPQFLVFIFLLATFVVLIVGSLMRKNAIWILIGQLMIMKTLVAAAFFLGRLNAAENMDALLLSYVSLGFLPIILIAGMLVVHRMARLRQGLDLAWKDSENA